MFYILSLCVHPFPDSVRSYISRTLLLAHHLLMVLYHSFSFFFKKKSVLETVGHTNVTATVEFYSSDNSEKKKSFPKILWMRQKNAGEEEKRKQKK